LEVERKHLLYDGNMCLRNKLKVGDRVRTKKFHSVYGEIIEIYYTMYKIEIDNPVNNWTVNNRYEWAFEKELLHIVTICA